MTHGLFGDGGEPDWVKRHAGEIRRLREALAKRYAPMIHQVREAHRRVFGPEMERQLRDIDRALGQLPDMTE